MSVRAKFRCTGVTLTSRQPYETTLYRPGAAGHTVGLTWPRTFTFTAVTDSATLEMVEAVPDGPELALTAAVTRVLAMPAVEGWLRARGLLSAEPRA